MGLRNLLKGEGTEPRLMATWKWHMSPKTDFVNYCRLTEIVVASEVLLLLYFSIMLKDDT